MYISEYDNMSSNDLATGLNTMTSYTASYGLYGASYTRVSNPLHPEGPSATSIGWSPGVKPDLAVDESVVRYFKLTR